MPAPLIVVSGTGTEIGKTHASVALVLRWARGRRVCGVKPIETGVPAGGEGDDARRLRSASSFHVKHPFGLTFEPPISPHLAARRANVAISLAPLADDVARLRDEADGVLLELAGGLFSPLAPGVTNATFARQLAPTSLLLVAPDRLGVLHDVAAATRAAAAFGLRIDGIVLLAPATPDTSTGQNGDEIAVVTDVPLLATFPRASSEALADLPETSALLAALLRTQ